MEGNVDTDHLVGERLEAVHGLEALADEVVCVDVPFHLRAVGLSYRDFSAVGEDEVGRLLQSF